MTTIKRLLGALLNKLSLFAGGMLTKQATFFSNKFLNDINDTTSGGIVVGLPAGVQFPQVSQTIPGDRIVLDDATALAVSDTGNVGGLGTGQLFGGVYMYVQTFSGAAAAPARGTAAFYRAADLPPAVTGLYQVSSDAQPSAAVPTILAGVFLGAITRGNFCWIQVAGIASCLFDSAITTAAVGNPVSAKISAAVASTFDVGVVVTTATIALSYAGAYAGTAIVLPVASTVSAVLLGHFPIKRI